MAITLNELLERIPREVETRVKSTRERTQSAIRDALRSECRLVFRTPEDTDENRSGASVSVEVAPGHPEVLRGFSYPDDYRIALILARYRYSLEMTIEGVPPLAHLHEELVEVGANQFSNPENQRSVRQVSNWTRALLQVLDNKDPLKRILAYNEDILGIYSYTWHPLLNSEHDANKAVIKLYWGIIGLVADLLGCTVEDLTIVVLTHELAHAYTQVGADIEGRRWQASLFAKADVELKEGLAQYYTERILNRFRIKHPKAISVFNKLLSKQPPAYHTHVGWSKDNAPEAVRRALIEARRSGDGSLATFESRYETAKRALSRSGALSSE